MPNISTVIKSIQDIMRQDTGVDGDAQRLSQLVWMLFLKIFDDREKEFELNCLMQGREYKSPMPENLRWRNWAAARASRRNRSTSSSVVNVPIRGTFNATSRSKRGS